MVLLCDRAVIFRPGSSFTEKETRLIGLALPALDAMDDLDGLYSDMARLEGYMNGIRKGGGGKH